MLSLLRRLPAQPREPVPHQPAKAVRPPPGPPPRPGVRARFESTPERSARWPMSSAGRYRLRSPKECDIAPCSALVAAFTECSLASMIINACHRQAPIPPSTSLPPSMSWSTPTKASSLARKSLRQWPGPERSSNPPRPFGTTFPFSSRGMRKTSSALRRNRTDASARRFRRFCSCACTTLAVHRWPLPLPRILRRGGSMFGPLDRSREVTSTHLPSRFSQNEVSTSQRPIRSHSRTASCTPPTSSSRWVVVTPARTTPASATRTGT